MGHLIPATTCTIELGRFDVFVFSTAHMFDGNVQSKDGANKTHQVFSNTLFSVLYHLFLYSFFYCIIKPNKLCMPVLVIKNYLHCLGYKTMKELKNFG